MAGVRVGHTTLIRGDGPLRAGGGPVRTGVTVVVPHEGDVWREPLFAGSHRLNGNGELTGLEWIREHGLLAGAIGITNTHSVGVVRDALVAASIDGADARWSLPVVGETYDGVLNDMNGFHVTGAHLHEALAAAHSGPVDEGGVGGGTGMICHEFKGGIGTASRVLREAAGGYTVGVLVQANYGKRSWLRIDGVRVGEAIRAGELQPFQCALHVKEKRIAAPSGEEAMVTGLRYLCLRPGRDRHALDDDFPVVACPSRLRAFNRDIKLISVQPESPLHGIEGLKHMETAIRPGIYDDTLADEDVRVSTERSHALTRRLAAEEGLLVGVSSGAALAATLDLAARIREGVIVTIFPDSGSRYLTESFWSTSASGAGVDRSAEVGERA